MASMNRRRNEEFRHGLLSETLRFAKLGEVQLLSQFAGTGGNRRLGFGLESGFDIGPLVVFLIHVVWLSFGTQLSIKPECRSFFRITWCHREKKYTSTLCSGKSAPKGIEQEPLRHHRRVLLIGFREDSFTGLRIIENGIFMVNIVFRV
jgi:hypothetical protein